jgi:sugar phosphate isomerase/epimerase
MTRRTLLAGALLAPPRRLGLALYTVRNELAKQPFEVLKLAAAIGYTEVEILRNQIAALAPHLKSLGLTAVSMHFETPLITGNWQAWRDAEMPSIEGGVSFESAIDQARSAGITNAVFNYLPPKERGDLDYYRALSDKLNAACGKCRAAGMRLWYHNHNFEFQPKSAGRPIDVLLDRLDRDIPLEADLFWIGMAGLDPAEFIRKHAGRIVAVHLKDRARNAAVPKYDIASVPNDTYEEVGRGDLPFPRILEAARTARVQHYFVEQDHSPEPLRSIRRSYAALRSLGL